MKKEVVNYDVPIVDLIEIKTNNPFKVLVTTMLSARTRDENTAKASVNLFKHVKKPNDLEKISLKKIENLIYPVGFYKNKAKYLKKLPKHIKNGIPKELEKLVEIPGVGRKTANLVRTIAFKEDSICVDTHVHRIMNRLNYVETKTPKQTEMSLRKKLPKKYWKDINSILVAFGQNTCRPISPFCSKCPIEKYCPKIGVNKSR